MVSKVDGKTSAAQAADADVAKKTPLDDGEKKKGMALLKYDLMKKELVPTKVLFAVVLSSIGVLLPYMTIHMKSLGITVAETAIIYGVYPIFAIFAPFSMGVIADKLGNFKVLLCGMFILTGINGMVFLAIPAGRFHQVYAANISLALGCSEPTDDGTRLSLTDLDSTHCQWEVDARENVTLTTTRCGYLCYQEPGALVLKQAAAAVDWSVEKHQPTRLGRAIFFAGDWTLNVACGAQGCRLQKSDTTTANLTLDQVTLRLNHTVANVFPVEQMMHNNRLISGLQCASFDQPVRLNPAIVYDVDRRVSGAEDAAGVVYESCRSQCIVQTQRSALCANQHDTIEFNPQLTFWVYLVMRISYAILLSGVMVLFEGACLAVVIECKGDLGLQRMFGILGTMIFSPVSGALIDYYSQGQPTTDFRS